MLERCSGMFNSQELPEQRSGLQKMSSSVLHRKWTTKGTSGFLATLIAIKISKYNKDSVNGKLSYIKGKAFVVKNTGNAKLKVQFFWPFKGDYWVIDLADNYSYAVVSNPDKKSLWILSRTSKMDAAVYQQIITRLKEKGFDLTNLKITEQI